MSSSQSINYARAEGIQHKELGAAIAFAILYIPCIPILVYLSIKKYTSVWRSLVLFALGESIIHSVAQLLRQLLTDTFLLSVRSTAFFLRAVLAGSSTAGNDIHAVVAESVIYGIGFFGLLYSAYTLALDR